MRDFEIDDRGRFVRPPDLDDCSDEWRHACEVAHLMRMSRDDFRAHLQQIQLKRGEAAYQLLLTDCRSEFKRRKSLRTQQSSLELI